LQFPGKPINSADIDVIDLNVEDVYLKADLSLEGVAKKSIKPKHQLPRIKQARSIISPQAQENYNNSILNSQTISTEKNTTENDPNKLWCICQKTHNNRFMIACDTCQGNLLRGIVNWSGIA
jgi:hypothetical protein